jgi:hypothetical protein
MAALPGVPRQFPGGYSVYSYPPARMGGDVDDYHGELIADRYRWL